MSEQRYCLETDGDGHSYVIPVELREEFSAWVDFERRYWEHPSYTNFKSWDGIEFDQYEIDGFHRLTFTNPKEE